MPKQPADPYTPPPMHHDRSGAVVRIAIVAALIGASAWAYMAYSGDEGPGLVAETSQEQQLADTSGDQGYAVSPATAPAPAPAVETQAPAPTPAPRAPRRATPAPQPTPDPVVTTPAPPPVAPSTPTPLPPDVTTGD